MASRGSRRAGLTAALLAATALTACGGGGGGGASGSDTTLTVAWASTPPQLDPNVFTGLTWLYALGASMGTLFEYDTDVPDDQIIGVNDLRPSLAETAEPNADETSYTISLRQGVMSPYGNEMTADDVVYSFERMFSDPTSLQAGILLATGNVDPEQPIEKIDDYTVRYNLTAPSAVALSVLAYPIVGVLDSTEVEQHATADDEWAGEWLAENTASFGAYQLESFDPGNEIRFSGNPNYFGERSFEEIVIRAVPEASSRAQLVSSGEVDLISEPPIDQLETIDESANARVSEMPDTNRHNLTLSEGSDELSVPLVRQAINRAIDREDIVESIYQGNAEPASTPVTSTLLEDQPSVGGFDPDAARELLAEAGYPDGFGMTLSYNTGRPGPFAEDLARLIQGDLGEVGIEVSLEAVPSVADFEAGIDEKSYEAYLYTERPSQPEIGFDLFLYLFSTSPLNDSGYDNPEFDRLVDRVLDLPEGEERTGLIDEALDTLVENSPLVSLVEVPDLAGVAESVDGYSALPSGGVQFQDLSRE